MKIKMLPQDERPVEKAIYSGIGSLTNVELLAILLGSGTQEKSAIGLAEDIISADQKGISHLAECSTYDLTQIKGVGSTKAVRLLAGIELGMRIASAPGDRRTSIRTPEDIAIYLMKELRFERKEHFMAVLLNAKGEITSLETISIGNLTTTTVHPRESFTQAVRKSAAAVIFAHNHPSGDPTPSEEDIETTKRLIACGDLLGVKVIDHIVIGDNQYRSIACIIEQEKDYKK